jgi:outer membrane biosynthesis protein TonB
MGLWEFLRQWPRGRLIAGVATSILVHAIVTWGVLWGLQGDRILRWAPKKGDTIIVELPKPEEPASAGSPAAPPPPAPRSVPPRPSAPAAARPTPPPRAAPAPPREERRVASAPPRPVEPPPAPKAPEPAPSVATPAPPSPEPAPNAAEPPPAAPKAAEPAPRPAEPAAAEVRREPADRQVASLPPGGSSTPSVGDVRAALRQGAGGRGQGRGGIEGDPIPLDSVDTQYVEYLEQVRRRIKEKWGFPCVRNAATRACEHHSTSLDVHFGILKNGQVQFVDVVRLSDHSIYDDYAVRAILLAQPYPPVPPAMMRAMKAGSAGLAISARFSYVVESSLTNLLR